jgi:hypothetical protein
MNNNKKYISQNGLTIITEVDSTKDIKILYNLLVGIGDDVNNQTIVNFKDIKNLHFARWFLIEGATDSSGNKFPNSLAFVTDFDGDVDDHLHEIMIKSGKGIDTIYQYCKGYPSKGSKDIPTAVKYFKSHIHKNQLFWTTLRGGTVEQLLGEQHLRESIERYLTEETSKGHFKNLSPDQIKERILEFVEADSNLNWALQKRAAPGFKWNFNYYGKLVFKLSLILVLLPLILFLFVPIWVLLLSRIFEKRDDKNRKEIIRSKAELELLDKEDRIYMNQFTIFGTIKKPYWYRLTTLRMGLWLFATNGAYRATKGKLSGIESIHFARWCIFNNGKNVMFLSNYDGSWQIYLSEFIDRSAAAMNLTFGTTVGYPKVKYLFAQGAFDEQAFKTVVRNNQYPTQVFYSKYPYLTSKNINNNARIRKGLDGSSKESTSDWLKRF